MSEQTGPATADRRVSIRDGELCRAGNHQGNLSRGDCHYAVDADGARETGCVCGWLTRPSSSHTRAAARWRTAARGAGREWRGARALSLLWRGRSDGHSCLCMCPSSMAFPTHTNIHAPSAERTRKAAAFRNRTTRTGHEPCRDPLLVPQLPTPHHEQPSQILVERAAQTRPKSHPKESALQPLAPCPNSTPLSALVEAPSTSKHITHLEVEAASSLQPPALATAPRTKRTVPNAREEACCCHGKYQHEQLPSDADS